jgi:hypothetical protein
MPVASDRAKAKGATSRGRSSTNGSRNARSSSSGSARAKNSSSRARNSSSSRAKNSSSKAAGSAAKKTQSASQRAQGASQQNHGGREVLTNAGVGALGAALGVAGGVLLGRTAAQRDRKVLGVPVPEKIDFGGIGQQIGDAGKQLGKLASEVRTVREKAEQIARILT